MWEFSGSNQGSVCTPGMQPHAFPSVEVGLLGKGAASPPNYDTGSIVAGTDAFSEGLVRDQLGQKTSNKCISSSIGINNFFLVLIQDSKSGDFTFCSQYGVLSPLGENHNSLPL